MLYSTYLILPKCDLVQLVLKNLYTTPCYCCVISAYMLGWPFVSLGVQSILNELFSLLSSLQLMHIKEAKCKVLFVQFYTSARDQLHISLTYIPSLKISLLHKNYKKYCLSFYTMSNLYSSSLLLSLKHLFLQISYVEAFLVDLLMAMRIHE